MLYLQKHHNAPFWMTIFCTCIYLWLIILIKYLQLFKNCISFLMSTTCPSYHIHLNLLHFKAPIFLVYKLFITWLLPNFIIKLSSKVEYGLCQLTKMASKMAANYRFALVDTLTFIIMSSNFFRISYLLLLLYSLAQLRIWVLSDER